MVDVYARVAVRGRALRARVAPRGGLRLLRLPTRLLARALAPCGRSGTRWTVVPRSSGFRPTADEGPILRTAVFRCGSPCDRNESATARGAVGRCPTGGHGF